MNPGAETMLASTFFDLCVGVDIHFEMVPTPAPVPTPFPNPFVGMVFDPLGLAVGLAIGAVISAAVGAPITGPVLINGMPATNVGTEAKNYLGVPHIIIPPGTKWAPMPKLPKPAFKGPPDPPGLPIAPEGDAICILGSQTVTVMGASAVRTGELAMSCGEPVRLPSSVIIAIPKGPPVLIGGPSSVSLADVAMALFRSKWVAGALHSLISRMKPGRLRNFLHRGACFLTGHPVDVASGRVLSSQVDLSLPGPIPLVIERNYASSWSRRSNTLGHGWHSSVDQAIWAERGRLVFLTDDGRELEFDTFDLPGRRADAGQVLYDPVNNLTLRVYPGEHYEIEGRDGVVREFRPIVGSRGERVRWSRLFRLREPGGARVEFGYGIGGDLEWVRDSCGRCVRFEHDHQGRLTALGAPEPDAEGWFVHTRYIYDDSDDLVEVVDALGHSATMEYVEHLLVRETDRNGFGFYFSYDGVGEDAWCVRTWGDDGVYDHVLDYAKAARVTTVTDSLGHTTIYSMNDIGLVTKIVDACGAEVRYEYDEVSLAVTGLTGPDGGHTTFRYDARGNPTGRIGPDGVEVTIVHDAENRLSQLVDERGGEWRFEYTREQGPQRFERTLRRNPAGEIEYFDRKGPYLVAVGQGQRRLEIDHDESGNASELRHADGRRQRFTYDRLGRLIAHEHEGGSRSRWAWDRAGRCVASEVVPGHVQHLRYDAEGQLLEVVDTTRSIRFTYGGFRVCVAREEGGTTVTHEHDTENRLRAVVNEFGERWTFERDGRGRVIAETGFDGRRRRYRRDAAGRLIELHAPSGMTRSFRYDALGRLLEERAGDGSRRQFSYDRAGALLSATNESGALNFEVDPVGRLTIERSADGWVGQFCDVHGDRVLLSSSAGALLELGYSSAGRLEHLRFGESTAQEPAWVRYEQPIGGARQVTSAGVEIGWVHDEVGRPVEQHQSRATTGEILDVTRWDWRGVDQIAVVSDRSSARRYDHDAHGAVIAERRNGDEHLRAHDQVGNLYRRGDGLDRRYGPGGRLLEIFEGYEFRYDEDGNRVEKLASDGRRWQYHWNGLGQLCAVDLPDDRRVELEYDALGRRTRERVRTCSEAGEPTTTRELRWIWDGHHVLHEIEGERTTTWYWHPNSWALVGKQQGDQRWFVVCDQLGTPTQMFDETGEPVWRGHLDLFGQLELEIGEPSDCPFRWPGQQADDELGEVYNRFRYYAPNEGVYLSPDPLGLAGGLRLYAYVLDPLVWFDFFGLESCYFEPMEVHFGQRRISANFATIGSDAPHYIRGRAIMDVAADLRAGKILPEDMLVDVFRQGDIYVAVNNRSLAALSLAGFQPTMGRIVSPTKAVQERLVQAPVRGFSALPAARIPATVGKLDDSVLWVVSIVGH
jgi:RHS repeat-associated protein